MEKKSFLVKIMQEQVTEKVRQYNPKLYAALVKFHPVWIYKEKKYQITRISALEGKFYEAVLIEGLSRAITVVLYSELNSSITESAFWAECPNDYARETVGGHTTDCKALLPVLHSIMKNLTVHDLIEELCSIRNGKENAYDYNNPKDFHILTDVLNKAPHVLFLEKSRRYNEKVSQEND